MKAVSPHQFALFRIAIAIYLFIHFISLIPWAPEMFSQDGLIPSVSLNPTSGIFPNILGLFDTAIATQVFLGALAVLSLSLLIGWKRQLSAFLLWYGWACLFNRNIFTGNPGLAFIGWILLALAVIPRGEPWAFKEEKKDEWSFPREVFFAAWVLVALGYTVSGLHKMGSPSWANGQALQFVLENPLARDNFITHWLRQTPGVVQLMTWFSLALEVSFLFFALFRKTRFWIWLALVGMHIGIITTIDFADLTCGLLIVHLFTFDRRWLKANKQETPPILFFDGVCGLCNHFVDFLFKEDMDRVYKVATLQGEAAKEKLPAEHTEDLNSLVIYRDGHIHTKSNAVLLLCSDIGGLWRVLSWTRFLPQVLRDWVYDNIAQRRYSFFGKKETCRLPTPEERALFLN